MINPFASLGAPSSENIKGEAVSGSFSCQEDFCEEVMTEAKYLSSKQVLTWICSQDHISKIEGIDLD